MSNAAKSTSEVVRLDPWQELRRFTHARIALGRAGNSLPTDEVLRFGLAHAGARDAVHWPLDAAELEQALSSSGWRTLRVHSQAADRAIYLLRPDFGRRLSEASAALLAQHAGAECDLLFVAADGLSALAVQRHVLPLLDAVRILLPPAWSVGPVVIAEQSRVALGDEIGQLLRARIVVMLVGERPGLSSPDSLGVYLTFAPQVGRSDAERNCISNVRPQGLEYPLAAKKLVWLLTEARRRELTGVALKDASDALTDGDLVVNKRP